MERTNNGEAAKISGKRKNQEVVTVEATPIPPPAFQSRPPGRYFPIHRQPSNSPRLNLNINQPSAVGYNQNNNPFRFDLNAKPKHVPTLNLRENAELYSIKPKSFMSLLTEGDDELEFMPPLVKEQNDQIDQLIATEGERLKRSLVEAQRRQYSLLMHDAEERAAKKMKDKHNELSEMANQKAALENTEAALHREILKLQSKVKALDRENASLRLVVQESLIAGGKFESSGYSDENEDVESANVDPAGRVEPVLLVCKVCARQVANMMMWPCRHLCVCKGCAGAVRACPVCNIPSHSKVEINIKDD